MTNNNDWKQLEGVIRNSYVIVDSQNNGFEDIKDFISQNFIPLSSLKKFIEENERDEVNINHPAYEYIEGYNSVLKLLKKLIYEQN